MSAVVYEPIPKQIEEVAYLLIGCGITVHRRLGPGYKEPIYHRAMCVELDSQGISYESEKLVVVSYEGRPVGRHRLDLLVEGCVIGELKCVPIVKALHRMQVRSYLKATELRLGLVMNFNAEVMKNGIKRVVL